MGRGVDNGSACQITHFLKGITFPATHGDLFCTIWFNHAPPEVFAAILALPEGTYDRMAEVMHECGAHRPGAT